MKNSFLILVIGLFFVFEIQAQDSLSMLSTDEKPLIDLGEGGRGGFLSKVLNAKGQKLLADAGEANTRVQSLKKKSSKSKGFTIKVGLNSIGRSISRKAFSFLGRKSPN